MTLALDEVLGLLEGVRRNGSGYMARCPAHDDSKTSLSITEGEDGKILWHCMAGCPQEAVGAILSPSGAKRDPVAVYDYTDEQGKDRKSVV